ncbi:hypothetical protein QQP08_011805 [Theobroma cacao]|nr:hypothetical protein QQP08_011805 [Theobroma cacao]
MNGFFCSFASGAELDVLSFASSVFRRACLNPKTMNKLVKVRSDSAPPCNQSTLDKEVPYFTLAVSTTWIESQFGMHV